MPAKFVNIDRDSPMLLPVDLHEWVQENDLVHFILEVVSQVDTSRAAINHRGVGSAQYPPSMMLSLLIYCYSTECFSSRKMERATYDSLAVRYICGNYHPDHDTIATFRRRNQTLLEETFLYVLGLARQMGLLKVGTLSIDGTKIRANARNSGLKNLESIDAELESLESLIAELIERAETTDKTDADVQGILLPDELSQCEARRKKLNEAKSQLEKRLEKLKKNRINNAQRYNLPPSERRRPGKKANPKTEEKAHLKELKNQKISLSDPESHTLPHRKERFIQGYNAQSAVCTDTRLIAATQISNEPNDSMQLPEVLGNLAPNEKANLDHLLVDKGYWDSLKLNDLEQQYQCRILCPPKNEGKLLIKAYPKHHPRKLSAAFKKKMERRLGTQQGKELYKKRSSVSEGVFSVIKNEMNFRSFRLRGLDGASTEWSLVTLAYNCRRMVALKN